MNHKEALFFVARCLTMSLNNKNRVWVENLIIKEAVCWDKVVIQSTHHYVLPLLYYKLKVNSFLSYLPKDLVAYMIFLTDLNRARNKSIIKQAKVLNKLLLSYKITPIFIKGTGFLLQEIYQDISERMIGDIDFLVPKKDALRAYIILVNNGYFKLDKNAIPVLSSFRHLPRLIKKDEIAAVEIHHEVTIKRYRKEFSYNEVSKNHNVNADNLRFLSNDNQVALSIIATQVNNGDSIYCKKIILRTAYDIYLLSQRTNTYKAIKNFKKLYNPLNNYLAISSHVLNEESINNKKTVSSIIAIKKFHKVFFYTKKDFFKRKLHVLKLSFLDKNLRAKIFKRIARKNWRKQKIREIGKLIKGFKSVL